MTQDTGDTIAAFVVGRTLAEGLGLSAAQANQWGAVQMAFGLSGPGMLVVLELARRDAAVRGSTDLATRQDTQEVLAAVQRSAADVQRAGAQAAAAEAAARQAAQGAEASAQASGQAARSAAEAAAASQRASESAAAALAATQKVGETADAALAATRQLGERVDAAAAAAHQASASATTAAATAERALKTGTEALAASKQAVAVGERAAQAAAEAQQQVNNLSRRVDELAADTRRRIEALQTTCDAILKLVGGGQPGRSPPFPDKPTEGRQPDPPGHRPGPSRPAGEKQNTEPGPDDQGQTG